jgi:hypothetical protein
MKMKSKRIAKYASMASNEAHEEYMNYTHQQQAYYYRDILSEMIDKFDRIEAMANDNWFKKMNRKMKYGNR